MLYDLSESNLRRLTLPLQRGLNYHSKKPGVIDVLADNNAPRSASCALDPEPSTDCCSRHDVIPLPEHVPVRRSFDRHARNGSSALPRPIQTIPLLSTPLTNKNINLDVKLALSCKVDPARLGGGPPG